MRLETTTGLEAALSRATEWQDLTRRIKKVLVERLDLPIPPSWITNDQPLFGRGLELDSLDALELSMAVDQEFGTPVYEDSVALFGSVSAFVSYLLDKQGEVDAEELEQLRRDMLDRVGLGAIADGAPRSALEAAYEAAPAGPAADPPTSPAGEPAPTEEIS